MGRLGAVVRGEPCRWDVASKAAATELRGRRCRREEKMEAGRRDGGGRKDRGVQELVREFEELCRPRCGRGCVKEVQGDRSQEGGQARTAGSGEPF